MIYRSALIALLIACCGFAFTNQLTIEKLVLKAADDQLAVYLAKIPQGHESEYGFKSEDQLDNCKVGKPYRLLAFSLDFYNAKELNESANYLEIKNEWRVPVVLNKEHRTLLTVTGSTGNLSVQGLGGADLAKDLQEKSIGASDTESWYLLRVPKLSADFFMSEHEGSFMGAQVVPLENAYTAIPALRKMNKPSYTIDEIQPLIRQAIATMAVPKEPAKKPTKKKKVVPKK